jgi:CspA family cold shock protein
VVGHHVCVRVREKDRTALFVGVALTVAALVTSCGGSSARTGTDTTSTTTQDAAEAQLADPVLEHCVALLERGATVDDCQAIGPVEGTVVSWNDDDGWGVLSSPAVDGEVWVHYSDIKGTGYRALRAGESVRFTYETVNQDGYPNRAVMVDRS